MLRKVLRAPSDDNYAINGLQRNDLIITAGGRDVVQGGPGDDTISTGSNDDMITYTGTNNGANSVDGGGGNDRINALANNTVIGLHSLSNVEAVSANGFTGVRIMGGSQPTSWTSAL